MKAVTVEKRQALLNVVCAVDPTAAGIEGGVRRGSVPRRRVKVRYAPLPHPTERLQVRRGECPNERRHKSAYSWRAKLGLDRAADQYRQRGGVGAGDARWRDVSYRADADPSRTTRTAEGRRALVADIVAKVRELAEARVDVVAYACTAGSMVNPRHALAAEVEAATGVPLVTTAAAIVDALEALGAQPHFDRDALSRCAQRA